MIFIIYDVFIAYKNITFAPATCDVPYFILFFHYIALKYTLPPILTPDAHPAERNDK